MSQNHKLVVVLDGECVVCSGFARFVVFFNPAARLMWAQHAVTREFLAKFDISFEDVMQSIVALHEGQVYRGSDAFIAILSTMPWFIHFLGLLISMFPKFIREYVYSLISRNRYTLFGKKNSCSLPDKEMKSKFLHPV
jgi:predicted DCC family thiol-disulfide oxidoreductase YuxK